MHLYKLFAIIVYVALQFSYSAQSTDYAQSPHFMHYWDSKSEAKAVSIIVENFKADGNAFTVNVLPDYTTHTDRMTYRLLNNIQPALFQWHSGWGLQHLNELKLLNTIKFTYPAEEEKIFPLIRQTLCTEKGWIAVPVCIHVKNWVWLNKEIFSELNLKIPKNIDQLIETLPKIKNAGYTPVSLGNQRWQRSLIFYDLLFSNIQKNCLLKFIQEKDHSIIYNGGFSKAVRKLKIIFNYACDNPALIDWEAATAMLNNKETAIQFMGDWIKNELTNIDYSGFLAYQEIKTALFNVDAIAFSKSGDKNIRQLQKKFARIIISPNIQKQFCLHKGSLPIRTDIDLDDFDKFSIESYNILKDEVNINDFEHSRHNNITKKIINLTAEAVWKNRDITMDELIKKIADNILIPEGVIKN